MLKIIKKKNLASKLELELELKLELELEVN